MLEEPDVSQDFSLLYSVNGLPEPPVATRRARQSSVTSLTPASKPVFATEEESEAIRITNDELFCDGQAFRKGDSVALRTGDASEVCGRISGFGGASKDV